jgi:hypothetical protein
MRLTRVNDDNVQMHFSWVLLDNTHEMHNVGCSRRVIGTEDDELQLIFLCCNGLFSAIFVVF